MFSPIETKVIELATGKFVPEDTLRPESFKQLKSALSDDTGRALSSEEDLARLRRLEKYSLVYLVKDGAQSAGLCCRCVARDSGRPCTPMPRF